MKKITKLTYAALVAVMALVFTSCTEKYTYDKAPETGSKVFFTNEAGNTVDVSFDESSFQVAVNRTDTNGELTVPLTVTMSEGSIFSCDQQSVTFADGQATAYLTFTYDPADVEYGKYDDITITIADEQLATAYGMNVYAFKAGKTEWKLIETNGGKGPGIGSYRDDLMTTFGAEVQTWDVEIYESVSTPGKYLVKAPYDAEGPFGENKMWSSADEAKEEYSPSGNLSVDLVIDATDPEFVYFPEFQSGYYYDGQLISFLSYIQYLMDYQGYTLDFLKKSTASGYFGKMDDGVITMPAGSILFAFDSDPYNFSNDNGLFAIALPGSTIGDFSAEIAFSGIFTDTAGQVFADAELSLGDDATVVKAVVVEDDVDPDAAADAIAEGDLEALDVLAGNIRVPIPEGMTGKLKIVVVVFNNGKVKYVTSKGFEYYGGGASPWKSLGVGYYVDDVIYSTFTRAGEPTYWEVEIDESTETPGLYRLRNVYEPLASWWGEGDGKADILVHAENPNGVYIPEQPIGLTYDGSDLSLVTEGGDLIDYLISYYQQQGTTLTAEAIVNSGSFDEYFGKNEDGDITFPKFPRTDKDGNPVTDDDGNPIYYSAYLPLASGGYFYVGLNGAMEIVLPSALEEVKAKARRAAAASSFARRLKGMRSNFSKQDRRRALRKLVSLQRADLKKNL